MTKQLKNNAYEYKLEDFLGQGSFAKVYKGIICKNNRVVAVRIMPLTLIKQYGNKIKQIIQGEVKVLKELSETTDPDSIFITKIYDGFLTENNVTMIIELCPNGNLEQMIGGLKGVPESQAVQIIYQIARGIQFISKHKVVHRDIKPDNIFIKKEKGFTIYKLGDFGFAVQKQANDQIVGTPIFMSPELFNEETYGSEVDVWAFGLLCHYILFKQYYFIAGTEKQIKKKVLNEPYKLSSFHQSKISKEMANFLTGCIQMDKKKRTSSLELCRHPVFDKVRQKTQFLIKQINKYNSMTESQLQRQTVKGKIANQIMTHQFLFRLAAYLTTIDRYNLASLYIIKHNLGELAFMRQLLKSKQNFLKSSEWDTFISTAAYNQTCQLLQCVINDHLKCFEVQFNCITQSIQKIYGPEVVNGIKNNLGNGPFDQIKPTLIIEQVKKWVQRLLAQKTNPEKDLKSFECMIALLFYDKRQLSINFSALQLTKDKLSLSERKQIFENQLKRQRSSK